VPSWHCSSNHSDATLPPREASAQPHPPSRPAPHLPPQQPRQPLGQSALTLPCPPRTAAGLQQLLQLLRSETPSPCHGAAQSQAATWHAPRHQTRPCHVSSWPCPQSCPQSPRQQQRLQSPSAGLPLAPNRGLSPAGVAGDMPGETVTPPVHPSLIRAPGTVHLKPAATEGGPTAPPDSAPFKDEPSLVVSDSGHGGWQGSGAGGAITG